jgi:outer membrane lipoprotein-sorting protein
LNYLRFCVVVVAAAVFVMALAVNAQIPAHWTPDVVLAWMDKSAKDFHSLTADIERVKYTAVVNDSSKETGHLFMQHDDKMLIEMVSPDQRSILRTGDSLFVYTPKINRVEEYNLGKNRSLVDQYVRLGFGTRSADMTRSYDVAVSGEEELDGKKVVVLELTPRSEEVRKQIVKVQMWVDEASWLPLQQKFLEATAGDYLLIHYTNLKKNLKLSDKKFKQDWPKNVNRVRP